jgi:hypothetical protein
MLSNDGVSRLLVPAVVCTILMLAGTARGVDAPAPHACEPGVPAVHREAAPAAARRAASMTRLMTLLQIEEASKERGLAMCFVQNPTQSQLDEIMARYNALPPTLDGNMPRYFVDTTVWTGNGQLGASGRATRANLTFSFPNDGVSWGTGPVAPNNLTATFNTIYGAGNVDRGREYIRQALASWRRFNGVTYTEVADDNIGFTQTTSHSATRGDVRIGSNPQGTSSGILAYDFFPNGGSDMTINSDQFGTGAMGGASGNYRYLRNVVAHEHGHGLAFIHSIPCDQTKLMEPFANTAFDGTQIDEIRGAARNYGDKYSGNNTGATAKDFGNLTTPILHSVLERNLSTNGFNGPNLTGEDWFKFTIDTDQNVVITATPTGATYTEGQQSSGCSGTTAVVNSTTAGNLAVELRNGVNGGSIVQSASSAIAGTSETLNASLLSAGTYWVRIMDQGPNTATDQFVQLYDMTIRVGTSKAPPVAIAGVNKRVAANTNCYYMGNINSYTVDGAAVSAYAWDLDGDGVFGGTFDSTAAQPAPHQYVSNGSYPVKLRITDSNGMQSIDTINIVVFGATASITGVSPNFSGANVTVPVTITGVNLKGVISAAQVTLTPAGSVTVSGTPVVNALGTQITGLVFNVSAGAAGGLYTINVTNSDGTNTASGNGSGANLYNITANCVAPTITQQPVAGSVCSGGSFIFTAAANGSAPNFQWRKNTANIAGATSPTYTINSAVSGDAGSYDCVISNGCGTATTTPVDLTFGQIIITVQPTPFTTVCPGASVVYTVVSSGAASFQWQHGGEDIIGETDATLTINPVTPDDAGGYNCIVTSPCQSRTSNTANLTVRVPVTIATQPSPVSVCEGAPATLSLVAVGNGRTYQWRKNTVNIPGATLTSYTIPVTAAADSGNYDCIVGGTCGGDTSATVALNVCSTVSISVNPTSVLSCTGGTATFSVTATGNFLNYQWRKGGNPISGATGSSLVITPVSGADLGSYDCIVSNCCQTAPSTAATLGTCVADFNCSGSVSVADIFDYLAAWFAGSPTADINGGGIGVQDIFDFLAAWFAGC